MAASILLIEDDECLNRAISRKLEKEGYTVYSAFSLEEGSVFCRRYPLGVIICDIGLPDGSGLDFCREVGKYSNAVFLFLTALDTETDVLRGYGAGADDYITKPFSLDVLVSKVQALTKRYGGGDEPQLLVSGDIVYFLEANRVEKNGVYLNLTATEQKLLLYFMENPMRVLSKNQLLAAVWDIDGDFVDENTLAVNIRRLREKVEENPSEPLCIKNLRGLGYIWKKECEKK